MTNEQFKQWREQHFRSRRACAIALGLNPDQVASLETGVSRCGNPYPVPHYIYLATQGYAVLNARPKNEDVPYFWRR